VSGCKDSIALPFAEAERNAEWVYLAFRHAGAIGRLLLGSEATTDAVKAALGSLQKYCMDASDRGKVVKLFVYFSGRGRYDPSGEDMCVACHDTFPLITSPAEFFDQTNVLNLHQLARTSFRPLFDATSWTYPVVVADVVADRNKWEGHRVPTSETDAQRMDSLRRLYYGFIISSQHLGANLSATCSARHHSFVGYYFLKALDGKLTSRPNHIGSLQHIVHFVAERVRRRNLPTLSMSCEPLSADYHPQVVDYIVQVNEVFFTSAGAKAVLKKERELRKCQWIMYCEIDVSYRSDITKCVTQINRRLKELVATKSVDGKIVRKAGLPPLLMWFGSARQEQRLYLPLDDHMGPDLVRLNLIDILTSCYLGREGGSVGARMLAKAEETLEKTAIVFTKADHCCTMVDVNAAGLNRWSWGNQGSNTTPEYAVPKNNDGVDFVTFVSSSIAAHEPVAMHFMEAKEMTEVVALNCTGSLADLRRVLKFARFGQLDVKYACNCRIERVEVTSFGFDDDEDAKALEGIQRVVRKYLMARLLRSRLAAMMTYTRNYEALWKQSLDEWSDGTYSFFVEYQEQALLVLSCEQRRERGSIVQSYDDAMKEMMKLRLDDWVNAEARERRGILVDEMVDQYVLKMFLAVFPSFVDASLLNRKAAEISRVQVEEARCRQRLQVERFGDLLETKRSMREEVDFLKQKHAKTKKHKPVQRTFVKPLEKLMKI
jgi:hypothetical protein